MPFTRVANEQISVGTPVVIEAPSPAGELCAVFEDDGESGYFYATMNISGARKILDAVMIYDVASVADRHLPSQVEVIWSEVRSCVAILINRRPYAVFDFQEKRGYCREEFPPSHGEWTRSPWDENLRKWFL
jgi:hypothetical protein